MTTISWKTARWCYLYGRDAPAAVCQMSVLRISRMQLTFPSEARRTLSGELNMKALTFQHPESEIFSPREKFGDGYPDEPMLNQYALIEYMIQAGTEAALKVLLELAQTSPAIKGSSPVVLFELMNRYKNNPGTSNTIIEVLAEEFRSKAEQVTTPN